MKLSKGGQSMGYGYTAPEWVGAAMALIGLLLPLVLRKYMKNRNIETAVADGDEMLKGYH